MEHKTEISRGTDVRNNKVICSCGWAYSSTMKEVKARELFHVQSKGPYRWNSPMRLRIEEPKYVYENYY